MHCTSPGNLRRMNYPSFLQMSGATENLSVVQAISLRVLRMVSGEMSGIVEYHQLNLTILHSDARQSAVIQLVGPPFR